MIIKVRRITQETITLYLITLSYVSVSSILGILILIHTRGKHVIDITNNFFHLFYRNKICKAVYSTRILNNTNSI